MKFIGMDAHSRQCTFSVRGKSGKMLRRAQVKTTDSLLIEFIESIKGPKALAFEEGVMSQWLYMLFHDRVDRLVVCQPTESIGAKTDKIDAGEIADLLRVDRLKSVFHANNELMRSRVLISGYGDLVQELTRAKNRYSALYRQVAISTKVTKFYTSEDMISLLGSETQRHVAQGLFEQIALLSKQQQEYRDIFEANVRKHKPIRLLTSIPGLGPVRANQIAGIIVTPHRFPNKYHFFSYAMLTKHNRISDGKLYGRKKAHGQALLKEVFKTAAYSAVRSDNAYKRKYDAMMAAGKDSRAAINAVARMIAATVLGVWKSGKKYNDKQMEVTRRQNQKRHSDA